MDEEILAQLRDWLKEDANIDFDDKDEELSRLVKVSHAHCLAYTNHTDESLVDEYGEYPCNWLQAVLLFARHLFETGGQMVGTSFKENPMGFYTLLNQFKRTLPI